MKKTILASLVLALTLNATDNINYNGEIVNIKLSKDSWNRLIFDSDINAEPIYSKEKNIEIYKANQSVFIKFKPMLKVEMLDKKENVLDIDYDKSKKSELFISTEKATYSFTIEPSNISAKTYFIQNNQTANQDILKFEIDPVRKVLKQITKSIFLDETIQKYEKKIFHTTKIVIGNLEIKPRYIFDGKIYKSYLYDVTALETTEVPIDEKIFLQLSPTNKRSISIKDKMLQKNQTTSLAIIVGK
jgi:hypothetical protein